MDEELELQGIMNDANRGEAMGKIPLRELE
jgi:hypothetical protein